MPHSTLNIEDYHSGDSHTIKETLEDPDGTAITITSASIEYGVFETDGTQIFTKSVGSGITIVDGSNGRFDIAIDPSDTASLSGRKQHECEVTKGSDVATVFTGELVIEEDLIT